MTITLDFILSEAPVARSGVEVWLSAAGGFGCLRLGACVAVLGC